MIFPGMDRCKLLDVKAPKASYIRKAADKDNTSKLN